MLPFLVLLVFLVWKGRPVSCCHFYPLSHRGEPLATPLRFSGKHPTASAMGRHVHTALSWPGTP